MRLLVFFKDFFDTHFEDFLGKRQETTLIWKQKQFFKVTLARRAFFFFDVFNKQMAHVSTGGKTALSQLANLRPARLHFAPAYPQCEQPVVFKAAVAAVTFPLAPQDFVSVSGWLYTASASNRWHDGVTTRTGQVVCVNLTPPVAFVRFLESPGTLACR